MDETPRNLRFHLNTAIALFITSSLLILPLVSVIFRTRFQQSGGLDPELASELFLYSCLSCLLILAWRMPRFGPRLLLWFGLSIPLGILGIFVPFGDKLVSLNGALPSDYAGEFCGQGVPVPVVIWERSVDYPNPLGMLMNPPVVFIVGAVILFVIHGIGVLIRYLARQGLIGGPSVEDQRPTLPSDPNQH